MFSNVSFKKTLTAYASEYFNGQWDYKILIKTIYSVVQAVLAWKQHTSPQYASQILTLQRYGVLSDIATLGADYYELYQEAKKSDHSSTEKKWYKSGFFLILSGLAIATICAVAVSKINQYLKPTIDLTKIAKNVIQKEDLNDLKFSWHVPKVQQVSQWIYLNRIFTNLVLTVVSSHKILHLTSAIFQGFSLVNISHLQWVSVEKSIDETFRDSYNNKIASLWGRISFSFFIPPASQGPLSNSLTLHHHLDSCIQSIGKYVGHCFDTKIWREKSHLGDKSLELFLQPTQLDNCVCGLSPWLTDVMAEGSHSIYGSVPIEVSTNGRILKS